ncbi:MAG TPA: MTAP family purine nucleoside phosphorylase [Tepidisphaeraceae bacterium]|nr:MTAP family purine nucleoside phosphorylase [Tepidisphaeraceae bacterium]
MDELRVGVIGGTGLGEALLGQTEVRQRHQIETPFGRPSDAIIEGQWQGVPVLLLSRHGRGHVLNPTQVPYRANIFALKQLGCTHIIASGAVGSLREEMKPRDLVIADQVIDKTSKRASTFYENAAVHVEFAEPFCPLLRQILLQASGDKAQESVKSESSASSPTAEPGPLAPYTVHDRGCYVAMEGPAFSSRAESLMHRLWGGDLIGMTAMPEAKLAREAEISYALVALVTDYDSWRHATPAAAAAKTDDAKADPLLLLEEIKANLRAASDHAIQLIQRAIERMAGQREALLAAPSRQALRLAVWSEEARIAPEEIERLRPLWGRYFDNANATGSPIDDAGRATA